MILCDINVDNVLFRFVVTRRYAIFISSIRIAGAALSEAVKSYRGIARNGKWIVFSTSRSVEKIFHRASIVFHAASRVPARDSRFEKFFFFFFENSLANETGRRLSNSRYHLKQLKQKSSYVVRLFSSFFHPSAMVKIFFSRSVFQNTDGARSRKTIGLFSFYLWYDT